MIWQLVVISMAPRANEAEGTWYLCLVLSFSHLSLSTVWGHWVTKL